jgi:putative transposase
MARRVEVNGVDAAMELIMQEGFEGLGEAVRTLINEAMRIERARHLGADAWERSEARRGHANGYKAKVSRCTALLDEDAMKNLAS